MLHGIIERIEEVWGLEISHMLESAAVISTCHKNNQWLIFGSKHALSVFRIILLVEQLWSSKANNLLKIPFFAQNFKTYSFSNIASGTTEHGVMLKALSASGVYTFFQYIFSNFLVASSNDCLKTINPSTKSPDPPASCLICFL